MAYTLRTLRRAPAFTVVAVLTLALGIAATTAVVSVIDGVLLRGLPYRDPEQLMGMTEQRDDGTTRLPSYPTYKDWRAQTAGAVRGLAFVRGRTSILRGEEGPERLPSGYVTPGFFGPRGTRSGGAGSAAIPRSSAAPSAWSASRRRSSA